MLRSVHSEVNKFLLSITAYVVVLYKLRSVLAKRLIFGVLHCCVVEFSEWPLRETRHLEHETVKSSDDL